jgi:transcriptional regulator with XRE-family HTH domain
MTKAERDQLRSEMMRMGCTPDAVARQIGRCWQVRPREAYRHALGWSQDEVARRFSEVVAGMEAARTHFGPGVPAAAAAAISGSRIGEYERWPQGGRRPSPYVLAVLSKVYGTAVGQLLDAADHRAMPAPERAVLAALIDRANRMLTPA